jgi:tetratricopeptide (TPR) repeat protein
MTALKRSTLAAILLCAAAATVLAQTPAREGIDILLGKARSLEARGRMDLAAQNWSQVLLVDANQTEALEGLARYAKEKGDAESLRGYLDRLRRINPANPAIAAIEHAHVMTSEELKLLDEAGRLATQHKPDEAMAAYRRVFGDAPPAGRWAEAFYEAEAASTGGRENAVAQLRARVAGDPANEIYRLWLARVLTYDPKTRAEGLTLLQSIRDAGAIEQARAAWRQALAWEKGNPAAMPSLEAYVARYPDRELQADLLEQQAFQALRGRDFTVAEAKFAELMRQAPSDANAVIGLANVRLGQQRFEQALTLFGRAQALSPERRDVKEGIDTARFWLAMRRGAALQTDQPDAAIAAYQEALALRPGNEQALLAVGQTLQRRGELAAAQNKFEQVIKESPDNVDALAGLGFVSLSRKDFGTAAQLFARARALAPRRAEIEEGYRVAEFWEAMQRGADALTAHRIEVAVASFRDALAIDSRASDAIAGLGEATRLSGDLAGALTVYRRLVTADPADVRGWIGVVRTQIDNHDPQAALQTVRTIPEATQQRLATNPEYLALRAQVLYLTDQKDAAERALDAALEAASRDDSAGAVNARLEVANLLTKQARNKDAALVYRQVANAYPDNTTAWEGLIGAYTSLRAFSEAEAAVQSMPRNSYDAAMNHPGFVNAVAYVYASNGRCSDAEHLLTHSIDLDKAAGRRVAEQTQLQLADVWTREGRHDRASQAYHDVLVVNPQSVEAWRGYVAALHDDRMDYSALAEVERMPAAVRTSLLTDPAFLRLLGSSQAAAGDTNEAVKSLQDARSRHRSLGQPAPADLEVQLAWTMMDSSKYAEEVPALVAEIRGRSDLTGHERDALDELSSAWSLRTADEAVRRRDSAQAVSILTEAARQLPHDARIRAALSSLYVRQREYDRALDVYRSWDRSEASAADYRAAASTALTAGKGIIAEQFLWEGRQRWPHDLELLHMTAMRALEREDYEHTEEYLTLALDAARDSETSSARRPAIGRESESPAALKVGPATPSSLAGLPACRPDSIQYSQTSPGSRLQPVGARPEAIESAAPPLPAEKILDELDAVRNRNTPFAGAASPITVRLGDPGVNRLIAQDIVASGSVAVANAVRVGADIHFMHLSSGTPDGRSGYRFGSLPPGATFGEQSAAGQAFNLQVSAEALGAAVGMMPREFPVQNWTGGLRVGSPDDMARLVVSREPVKDSLLSYAGARDPGTGIVWGGVTSNGASLQLSRNESGNGQYLNLSGSLLRGEHVADNWGLQGTGGAYWRVAATDSGALSVGVNVTAMHYDRNLNFFSLGQGGYFSPQRYLLGAVPVSWFSHTTGLEYEISASAGVQSIFEEGAPLDPTQSSTPFYASDSRRGANYNVSFRLEYHVAPNWYLQAFAGASNARDYASQTFSITLRYLIERVPVKANLPLKTLPDWRGDRPFRFN